MDAYAWYLRSDHPMQVDALTVSPFLGAGSLQPAVDTARREGGGLFVLARTSNAEGGTVQHAVTPGGRTVAQQVVDAVREWNGPDGTADGWGDRLGSHGVVVGATLAELDVDLDGLGGPVLAPGLGAQGGSAADLRRLFGTGRAVVPTVSRDVLAAGPGPAALRAAADRWSAELDG
jgi:orotidine-5'-phosphate decarboxylase